MQVRRDFLQTQVVLFVAMHAAHLEEMLPFRLLGGQLGRSMAAARFKRNDNDTGEKTRHRNCEAPEPFVHVCNANTFQHLRLSYPILPALPGYPIMRAAGADRDDARPLRSVLRYAGGMILPTLSEIEEAQSVVYRQMPPTPQYSWPLINQRLGTETWIKHENHTPVGAFKLRGALVYLEWLKRMQPDLAGVVAATRGNHGQGVGMAARFFGLKAVIVVPHGNSHEKNCAMQSQGVELIEHGNDFQESLEFARELAKERSFAMVDSFHERLVMGTATYALEFFKVAPPLDVVFVPIGLGSSICGAAAARNALGLTTEIVGVVAAASPSYALSFSQRIIVEAPATTRIADGLACRIPNAFAMEIIWKNVSRIVEVSENEIVAAMRAYYQDTHNVAEGAAASALAATIKERSNLKGLRVGIVFSGGNVDASVFAQVLSGGFTS